MKREVIERTLKALEQARDTDFSMSSYGRIRDGYVVVPGCLALFTCLGHLDAFDRNTVFTVTSIVSSAEALLGLNIYTVNDARVWRNFALTGDNCQLGRYVTRQGAIDMLKRLLGTGVIDWRPYMASQGVSPELTKHLEAVEVELT